MRLRRKLHRLTRAGRSLAALAVAATLTGCAAGAKGAAERGYGAVVLPGIQYQVLRSGPAGGRHPSRADTVEIRYVGRLTNGDVFSTSADLGAGTSSFEVQRVIPGFMAAIQLMRPGDRWRITLPSYLAYGAPGRRYTPPEPTLKRSIPPDSILVFDVELVTIATPAPR